MYRIKEKQTKLQLLLDAIEPSQEERDDAVLQYFNNQEDDEYVVGGKDYFIFDHEQVENLIKEEWDEKADEFHRRLAHLNDEYGAIIDNLAYDEVVSSIVYDFNYDQLYDYKFETSTEGNDYYIYTEY